MPDDTHNYPEVRRDVVRLVVLDAENRVLLLHTRDLGNPEFGTSWELPGGGMEPGETCNDAAVRELREETGIVVEPTEVAAPTWQRDVSYIYRGVRRWQHERIATARLNRIAPRVESVQRVEFEGEDHFGFRWWSVHEIVTSSERFYPRSLPSLLESFLTGEIIDEPFESWP